MNSRVPEEYLCPISGSLMKDPISIQCGHSFDRDTLLNWLQTSETCPTCRSRVNRDHISTNWTLKSLIEKLNSPLVSNYKRPNIPEDQDIQEIEITSSLLKNNIDANYFTDGSITDLWLTVKDSPKRRPISFVCVIDVSGSMGSIVGNGEGGKAFTRLDLVKHVLNVIISSLTEFDSLGLITFSNEPYVVLDLMEMNEANKKLAKHCVKAMEPDSATYTGPAIRLAYEIIKNAPEKSIKSIILLTDGQDTDGHEILLENFERIKKPPQVQLNTFGFSNDILSATLDTLATKGGGIFGFIPDQSMIGTIFINFLANTFRTLVTDVLLEVNDNFEFLHRKEQRKKIILQFGRTYHFLLVQKNSSFFKKEPKFRIGLSDDSMQEINVSKSKIANDFMLQKARHKLLELVEHPSLPNVKLDSYLNSNDLNIPEFLAELKQTQNQDPNNEQIKLSLTYWGTWGQHYLKSFKYAHIFEQAINFKSPSMKFYKTPKFEELIQNLTDIFITLPPPTPSGHAVVAGPYVNMTNIMDRNAGCILSSCLVKMNSGEFKQIKDLKKGDILQGGSKVVCLIKSNYSGPLIKVNNLYITPYHPIFYNNKWIFPAELINSDINQEEDIRNPFINLIQQDNKTWSVCNLVLDRKHFVNVEGIRCITLGHGYEENSVLRHSYYGTNKCIQDLEKLNGWNEGCVNLANFKVKRDQNGLVFQMYDYEYQV